MTKPTINDRYGLILDFIDQYKKSGESIKLKDAIDNLSYSCRNEEMVIKNLISTFIYKDELEEYYFKQTAKKNKAKANIMNSGEASKNKNVQILKDNNLTIAELNNEIKLQIKREYGFLCTYAQIFPNSKENGNISNLRLLNISSQGFCYNFSWQTEKEFKIEALKAISLHTNKTFNALREILYDQGLKNITWSEKDTDINK